jgi:predicted ABC-type transport system involved in lysophospholipase L1 biosynthesis ATPase subunit
VSPLAPSRPGGAEAAARLLELGRLRVELKIGGRWRAVVQDVSLTLAAGQAAGIVGESGSGKSVTARSVARLLPPGARVAGDVRFDGEPVWAMNRARLRQYRARDIGIIYQDPRAHINTVHSIGDFLTEGVRDHDPRERRELAASALRAVGIPDPERRLKQYPHQLSGGLLQRVMIAAAIMPGAVAADMTGARHQQVPGLRLVLILWQAWPARGSGGADAGGLRALRALGDLELHVLVLLQAAEAVAVDLGVVHEDVRPVGAGDEAVALLRVEPLDGSLCHVAPYRGWMRARAVRHPGRFSTRLPQIPEAARPQHRSPRACG